MEKSKADMKHLESAEKGNCEKGTNGSQVLVYPNGTSREYMHSVITFIESYLGLRLSDTEIEMVWMPMLGKIEKWRLIRLDEYRLDDRGGGRTLAHVCKWLDDLRPMPEREPVREDLGYKKLEHKPDKEIGRRTLAHCKAMMDENKASEERDAMEREFIISMRRDFPHINWKSARKANANI